MPNPNEQCVACGAKSTLVSFTNRTFTRKVADLSVRLRGLAGQECSSCGEVFFVDESTRRYAQAGDDLVMRHRAAIGQELMHARKKLKLTQRQASRLTGGGHNAFSRYERGLVPPMPAVVNLFRLLVKHPKLLTELQNA